MLPRKRRLFLSASQVRELRIMTAHAIKARRPSPYFGRRQFMGLPVLSCNPVLTDHISLSRLRPLSSSFTGATLPIIAHASFPASVSFFVLILSTVYHQSFQLISPASQDAIDGPPLQEAKIEYGISRLAIFSSGHLLSTSQRPSQSMRFKGH